MPPGGGDNEKICVTCFGEQNFLPNNAYSDTCHVFQEEFISALSVTVPEPQAEKGNGLSLPFVPVSGSSQCLWMQQELH